MAHRFKFAISSALSRPFQQRLAGLGMTVLLLGGFLGGTLLFAGSAVAGDQEPAKSSAAAEAAQSPLAAWSHGVTIRPVLGDAAAHSIHAYYVTSPESPDGRRVLAYRSTVADAHQGEVVVVERATGAVRVLAENVTCEDAHRAACQQWTLDGRAVVFHDLRDERWCIVLVDVESGVEQVLARDRQLGWGQPRGETVPLYGPHWAPGEHRDLEILNLRTGKISRPLQVADVRRAEPRWLAERYGDRPISIFFPVLSPDERRVFFKLASPSGGGFRNPRGSDRDGFLCYDLAERRFLPLQPKWGHPAWFADSRHVVNVRGRKVVRIDVETAEATTHDDLPEFPGSHPAMSPDGAIFVTDSRLLAAEGAPLSLRSGENGAPSIQPWGVAVGSFETGEHRWLDRFENGQGAGSWRRSHPHPVFSADGRRIYYNVSAGSWTRLFVAEQTTSGEVSVRGARNDARKPE